MIWLVWYDRKFDITKRWPHKQYAIPQPSFGWRNGDNARALVSSWIIPKVGRAVDLKCLCQWRCLVPTWRTPQWRHCQHTDRTQRVMKRWSFHPYHVWPPWAARVYFSALFYRLHAALLINEREKWWPLPKLTIWQSIKESRVMLRLFWAGYMRKFIWIKF